MFSSWYLYFQVNCCFQVSIRVSNLLIFPRNRWFQLMFPSHFLSLWMLLSETDLVIWVQNGTCNLLHPSWNPCFPFPFSAMIWLLNGIIWVLINSISSKFPSLSRTKMSEKIFKILEEYQNVTKLKNIWNTKITETSHFQKFSWFVH